ncbi:hypothetical protein FY528_08330 [Hymenobacter lutimineralis]|uniref:Uncharacterized protein n=1 Tax=Hymenobacter lutimineralis TaxID=2606448 RepID=A0A5D6V5J1_9BACT|nr:MULTISPECIES: hypothetical protein [Hymenobacter]QIX62975.1 hypothetical protein HER32_18080 [Hymenobacter sp. BT18]TYZ10465.1 hypothetical protein FY528_08330 [Hymenobacter lutimineralis]
MKRLLLASVIVMELLLGAVRAGGRPAPRLKAIEIPDPVLVFYREKPPGTAAQQLIMNSSELPLLAKLSFLELVQRPNIYFDGIGNRELPGKNKEATRLRLVGTYALATGKPLLAPDGRSRYVPLRQPKQRKFYVCWDNANQFRTLTAGMGFTTKVDFQADVLPAVDSVRALYVLRAVPPSQQGAAIR